MKKIIELEDEFIGTGEVKGFKFVKIASLQQAYCYKVTEDGTTKYHYEVFKRKNAPLCIDFENRIYSETDFKEIYPKSNDFGVWAWTYKELQQAMTKFNELTEKHEKV